LSNSSRQIGHVVLSVDMDAAVAMALVYYVKIYLSVKHAQQIDRLLENTSTIHL